MGFKETLKYDLNKVFFNMDEFAEEYTWDKGKITAIVDDDDLIKKYSSEFEALSQGSHLIYVAESQFSKHPNVNDAHVFNGNLYTINEIKNEAGMLVIFLNNGRG